MPQLLGEIPSGETILVTAILALGNPKDGQVAWNQLPHPPRLSELEDSNQRKRNFHNETQGLDATRLALRRSAQGKTRLSRQ